MRAERESEKVEYAEERMIGAFEAFLFKEEKSPATIGKYVRDVRHFYRCLPADGAVTKKRVVQYKTSLTDQYAFSSANSMISSINCFFNFLGWDEFKVKPFRIQRTIYCPAEKELTLEEYYQLLQTAKSNHKDRLYLLLQTLCATGIRVSELSSITVEAVESGRAGISCKGKRRVIILPRKLCLLLKDYAQNKKIDSGPVFCTRNGNPLNRVNIWNDMKRLSVLAGVSPDKVYPHNLRHLFARQYYSADKDIVRLADLLGHSSIKTTRIYTMESGEEHQKKIEELGLIL